MLYSESCQNAIWEACSSQLTPYRALEQVAFVGGRLSLPQRQLERVRQAAAANLPAVVEQTSRICEIPAPTGHEHSPAAFIASTLAAHTHASEDDATDNVYDDVGSGSGAY